MTASYSLLTDVNGKPLPQMEDGHSGQPQVVQGAGSSSSIVRGRWWQVGSGATTTSIPMKSENGYTLTLTSQVQSQLVGSLFECLIGSTLYQAIVNAVSSSGTLTLDSALGSAPSAGTQFLLTPPDQTSLAGSNATILTSDGTNTGNKISLGTSVGDNEPALSAIGTWSQGIAFNESGWDRVRNNTQGTLLASAARTATTVSSAQTNYNAKGVHIILDITNAPGTPGSGSGLSLVIQGFDPVSNTPYQINVSPGNITTTGLYVYEIYPGASSTAPGTTSQYVVQRTAASLPRTWRIGVSAGNTDSYTYSVGYALIN